MEPASSQISAQVCWLNEGAPKSFWSMSVTLAVDLKCFGKSDFPVHGIWLYKVISPEIRVRIP